MKLRFFILCLLSSMLTYAQVSFKETFDANSLEWTECAYENYSGTAIIDKGVMTIKSKGLSKGLGLLMKANGDDPSVLNTFFESHCYAPIDVVKPFRITSRVKVDELSDDRIVGLVFNYKDDGNFYCFTFTRSMVSFTRHKDGMVVGRIQQGVKWSDKTKVEQEWVLTSVDNVLTFTVDGMPILNVRYMPLEYAGFGYYTYGKQTLVVDEVEFEQF